MIQASRASECQYRELTAAVAAMEAKLNWALGKFGYSLHPSGENKHLAPLSQRQACQLVVDAGLKILSTSFPGRELK